LNKVQDERMRVLRIQKKEEGLEKAPTWFGINKVRRDSIDV
jgi:hypothetical protein